MDRALDHLDHINKALAGLLPRPDAPQQQPSQREGPLSALQAQPPPSRPRLRASPATPPAAPLVLALHRAAAFCSAPPPPPHLPRARPADAPARAAARRPRSRSKRGAAGAVGGGDTAIAVGVCGRACPHGQGAPAAGGGGPGSGAAGGGEPSRRTHSTPWPRDGGRPPNVRPLAPPRALRCVWVDTAPAGKIPVTAHA